MNIYLDVDLRTAVVSPAQRSPVGTIEVKNQDTLNFNIYFCQNGQIVDYGSAAALKFGLVAQGQTTLLVLTTAFTYRHDAAGDPFYEGQPVFNTSQMNTAMGSNKSIRCTGEIRYEQPDGEIVHSLSIGFQVDLTLVPETGATPPTVSGTYPDASTLVLLSQAGIPGGWLQLDDGGLVLDAKLPATIERLTNKNQPGGYPGLTAGKVAGSILPVDGTSIGLDGSGQLTFLGTLLASITDYETTAGISLIHSAAGVLNRLVAGTGLAFDTSTPGEILINFTGGGSSGITALTDAETSSGDSLISNADGVLKRIAAGANITLDTITVPGSIIISAAGGGGGGVSALSDAETSTGVSLISNTDGILKRVVADDASIILTDHGTSLGISAAAALTAAEAVAEAAAATAAAAAIAAIPIVTPSAPGLSPPIDNLSIVISGGKLTAPGGGGGGGPTSHGPTTSDFTTTSGSFNVPLPGSLAFVGGRYWFGTLGSILCSGSWGGSGAPSSVLPGDMPSGTLVPAGTPVYSSNPAGNGIQALADGETASGKSLIDTRTNFLPGVIKRLVAGSNLTIDDTTTPGALILAAAGGGGGGGPTPYGVTLATASSSDSGWVAFSVDSGGPIDTAIAAYAAAHGGGVDHCPFWFGTLGRMVWHGSAGASGNNFWSLNVPPDMGTGTPIPAGTPIYNSNPAAVGTPSVQIARTTDQAYSEATPLPFNACPSGDPWAFWNFAEKLTIPTGLGGLYSVTFNYTLVFGSAGAIPICIAKNSWNGNGPAKTTFATAAGNITDTLSSLMQLADGDYINIVGFSGFPGATGSQPSTWKARAAGTADSFGIGQVPMLTLVKIK